jgi:ribosomal protein S18 acetylase RimI-like enzyme
VAHLHVRDLRESDAAAWWDLRLTALETEPFAFGRSADEHRATPVETIAARFRESSPDQDSSPHQVTAGAFDDDLLVGIATFRRESGQKDRHKGGIYGMYVAATHRRKRLARALMLHLIARAKRDTSIEQILVNVAAPQAAARALYRSLGFVVFGTEPRALKVGETYVDEDHLILDLRAT